MFTAGKPCQSRGNETAEAKLIRCEVQTMHDFADDAAAEATNIVEKLGPTVRALVATLPVSAGLRIFWR